MIKQKSMRLLLTFIIFILGGFYTFGNDNCCEQCCENLCCNKEKVKVENLVNENWLNKKKQNINFILNIFNKNENENENEYKSGDITIKLVKEDKDKTKIANLEDVEKKLKNNTQKWALFEIIYKKKEKEKRKKIKKKKQNIYTAVILKVITLMEYLNLVNNIFLFL